KPQPQMVDKWTVSDDKLTYKFTLRDGLKWHDGQPVRAADCIPSIERWAKRDQFGQKMMEAVGSMTADGDKSFTVALKAPFPLLLSALGKLSSNVPFMMPERIAKTDAFQQIPEAIGSGPFKFVKEEWVPGSKAVFVKNADYVPRKEPPSLAAGGKVAKIDRVEWLYIPDTATAAAALNAGEADWYEQPPADILPVFSANKDVTVATVDPLGNMGVLRFNHRLPPFDNVKMRQAVLNLVDQKDYMRAVAGDEKYWKACPSIFICGGTPLEPTAGAGARRPGGREWRRGVVRLAGGREARGADRRLVEGVRSGSAEETRRRDPGGSLHGGAVRPDRPVRRADRLSQRPRRHHHRPGGVLVERREKVTAISATSPHPNPPPRAGEGVYRRASLKNPPPLAGEGRSPR